MKKVLCLLLVLVLMTGSVPVFAEEENEFKYYDDFVYVTEGDRNVIVDIDIPTRRDEIVSNYANEWAGRWETKVTVPYSGDGIVFELGKEAFRGEERIAVLVFEEGITNIPEGLCREMPNLEEVVLPTTVSTIGDYAFNGCVKLSKINLENINNIGEGAFEGTLITGAAEKETPYGYFDFEADENYVTITGLNESAPLDIVIPGEINGKKVILEKDAFASEKIESVVIEEGITEIPQQCFYNCKNLKSVILPDSVTALGYLAFANSGIEEITLPENVAYSGYCTFFECSNLKRVDLNNAKSVGLFSFRDCYSLESVTHSGNLKGIADFAFAGCSRLKDIDLSTVESFGKNVFQGCKSLSFVNLQSLKEWEGFYDDDIDEESMMLKSTGFYSHHTYSDPVGYKALLLGTSINTVRIKFPETEAEEGLGAIFINTNVKDVVFDNFPENINKWEFYGAETIDNSITRQVKLEKEEKDFAIYGRDDRVREYAESIGAVYRELIDITVDGNTLYLDTLPYIKNDRTMVPMRAIFEALGATVSWDDETKTAIGKKGGLEVKITIGENVLYKNGEAIELDAVAEITNDRTMVPVRAVSEAFGCSVEWDNETRTVKITQN